jgi:orotidine-5'-phosphate decarboxylase
MTSPFASEYPQPKARERIIAALDVATAGEARQIVDELRDEVGAFKIGSQLFTSAGPDLVREFTSAGVRVFLDLKFHDIPNTVAKAAIESARLGVWMLNFHTLGGSRMMRQAVDDVRQVCEQENLARPLMIGVTVLTSSGETEMSEVGIKADIPSEVLRLARLAADSGLDGVVASPQESRSIREAVAKPSFTIVTPGIRPASATNDDQRRVTTFMQAIQNGSDYVVIGRPIIQSADRRDAVRQIVEGAENKR